MKEKDDNPLMGRFCGLLNVCMYVLEEEETKHERRDDEGLPT